VKIGDLVSISAYGSKLTLFYRVHGQIGIIVDERIGPDTGRQEYLVHFMNGEKHYVYRKEIKYVR
jgi:hypothetical protein